MTWLSASEWLVRSRVEPEDQLPAHLRLFHSARERDVGLGDSHMACGFNPPAGMLNLAFPGESVDNMEYKASRYFVKLRPGRVIVQADAHMFARYRAVPARGYNESFDRPPEEHSAAAIRTLSSYHRPKLFAYWNVWIQKGTFDSRTKLRPNGWTECPDNWMAVDPEARKSSSRERALLHEPAEDFSRSVSAAAYLRLLEGLAAKGARVCMVEFPVSEEYRQAISVGSYQAARAWFDAQARRLGLRYLAYAAAYADRPELFSDMDHLNAEGAKDFTRRIVRECFD